MVISLYIISNNAIFYLDHNIVTHENVRLCRSFTEKTNGLHLPASFIFTINMQV